MRELRKLQLGDWVQAVEKVEDEGVEVAAPGSIGHVIGPPDAEGWVNCYFEASGRVSVCAPSELRLLGDADTGKQSKRKGKRELHVN